MLRGRAGAAATLLVQTEEVHKAQKGGGGVRLALVRREVLSVAPPGPEDGPKAPGGPVLIALGRAGLICLDILRLAACRAEGVDVRQVRKASSGSGAAGGLGPTH